MFFRQMFQAGTNRSLPHRALLDRAAPQLSQLQMKGDHVGIQSHVHSFVTDDAIARATMTKRPVRSLPGVTTEALHVRHSPDDSKL